MARDEHNKAAELCDYVHDRIKFGYEHASPPKHHGTLEGRKTMPSGSTVPSSRQSHSGS